jgi:hypothetical protein
MLKLPQDPLTDGDQRPVGADPISSGRYTGDNPPKADRHSLSWWILLIIAFILWGTALRSALYRMTCTAPPPQHFGGGDRDPARASDPAAPNTVSRPRDHPRGPDVQDPTTRSWGWQAS